MKDYIVKHPWKIIEDQFRPEYNQITESLCSLGNGMIGQRGNFEEYYSGDSLQGNYIAGIYYPDKTRVGWWKNGYPEYFAKVLNSANWIGLDVYFGDIRLDLNKAEIKSFHRELDMQYGMLSRQVHFDLDGIECILKTERFCSYADKETGWSYASIYSKNYTGPITIQSFVDFDIRNQDSNYDENFWDSHCQHIDKDWGHVFCKTKKTGFKVCAGFTSTLTVDGKKRRPKPKQEERKVSHQYKVNVKPGQRVELHKLAAIVSDFHHPDVKLTDTCRQILDTHNAKGYAVSKARHVQTWLDKWDLSDIRIEGDIAAQQGIRFNIFHLNQTYTGDDHRLNIGPKGFTGEKYGGSTYWDTEAYCLPFYLFTAPQHVARNLLVYRYKHLQKAIENATKLGFHQGAALYPMVTINGEECHNEWEITFEEIHRNGAISYAIYDYITHTDDTAYMIEHGLEVLIAIARFWSQRVNWSEAKNEYVILGVTGPNEYENNVNNNWYTNYIARWCLQYTLDSIEELQQSDKIRLQDVLSKFQFDQETEMTRWRDIIANMYYPYHEKKQIYLQQDGFLDKEIIPVSDLEQADQPLNQHWSWDRILRSCYIKQADTLQGFYFFEDDFSHEELKRHFDFYEPLTVHESSLSPCVHSILACKLGYHEKAYEMYLRTSRLDLDDYNNDSEDGLHITSMAGTWMTITKGFAGLRVKDGRLAFSPVCPEQWESIEFKLLFRNQTINVKITKSNIELENTSLEDIECFVQAERCKLNPSQKLVFPL